MHKFRQHIAGLFLAFSALLIVPLGYWHDCSHGQEPGAKQTTKAGMSSSELDCALCDYLNPTLSLHETLSGPDYVPHIANPVVFIGLSTGRYFSPRPSLRGPPPG